MRPGAAIPALLLSLLALLAGCAPPRAERVVLISVDTLRADHLGAYGGPAPTPALDRIAAEGTRFETTISPAPLTLPSHTSLHTGLRPSRHGVHNNSLFRLAPGLPTLAEGMRAAGLATAAFVGAMVLDRQYGLARGFQVYDDRMTLRRASSGEGFPERPAGQVIDAALRWLDTAPDRFLLWIHLFDPHADYRAPPALRAAWPDSPYLAEVLYADREIGRLLEIVDARWPDGRTLVAVTADHGESLGEHGEQTHSLTLYDATQRVPLLLRGPGVPAGRVVRTPVRLIDVAPTLLARAGAAPLPDADGADLSPLLDGDASPGRPAYLETLATRLEMGWSPLLGLRTERFKYVRAPRPELYDLAEDPAETRNLAEARPELTAKLDAELEGMLAGAPPVRPNLELEPQARAQLEQLGYVAGSPAPDAELELGAVSGTDPKDGLAFASALADAYGLARSDRAPEALARVARIEAAGFFGAAVGLEAALEAGDRDAAERYGRAAVEEAPLFWEAHVMLGRALEAAGRLDEAREAFSRGAALDAAAADPLVGLGRIAEARGERERAAELYEQAAGRRGNSAEARWRQAALRIEASDRAGALALLGRVPRDELARPDAALRLARAELAVGHRERALGHLDEALRARPHHTELVLARARIAGGGAP